MWKYKSDYHITDAGVCISKCFPALYQIFCGDVDICEDYQYLEQPNWKNDIGYIRVAHNIHTRLNK